MKLLIPSFSCAVKDWHLQEFTIVSFGTLCTPKHSEWSHDWPVSNRFSSTRWPCTDSHQSSRPLSKIYNILSCLVAQRSHCWPRWVHLSRYVLFTIRDIVPCASEKINSINLFGIVLPYPPARTTIASLLNAVRVVIITCQWDPLCGEYALNVGWIYVWLIQHMSMTISLVCKLNTRFTLGWWTTRLQTVIGK